MKRAITLIGAFVVILTACASGNAVGVAHTTSGDPNETACETSSTAFRTTTAAASGASTGCATTASRRRGHRLSGPPAPRGSCEREAGRERREPALRVAEVAVAAGRFAAAAALLRGAEGTGGRVRRAVAGAFASVACARAAVAGADEARVVAGTHQPAFRGSSAFRRGRLHARPHRAGLPRGTHRAGAVVDARAAHAVRPRVAGGADARRVAAKTARRVARLTHRTRLARAARDADAAGADLTHRAGDARARIDARAAAAHLGVGTGHAVAWALAGAALAHLAVGHVTLAHAESTQ